MLEEPPPPPPSRRAKNPAYRADLLIIDVGAMTTKDGHASTAKPSVKSHLSVEQRKLRSGRKSWKTHIVTEDLKVANTDGELAMHALTIGKPSVKPIQVDLEVSGRKLTLDVDTGAAVFILSEKIVQQLLSRIKLKPSSLLLKTYRRMHAGIGNTGS